MNHCFKNSGPRDFFNTLGYYPKTDTVTARRLSGVEKERAGNAAELIRIPFGEMQSGVFPDIEKALADPGTEIDKNMGRYTIHRDYENSAKLNALIASGRNKFLVAYQEQIFELTIQRH